MTVALFVYEKNVSFSARCSTRRRGTALFGKGSRFLARSKCALLCAHDEFSAFAQCARIETILCLTFCSVDATLDSGQSLKGNVLMEGDMQLVKMLVNVVGRE